MRARIEHLDWMGAATKPKRSRSSTLYNIKVGYPITPAIIQGRHPRR
jgi:predicted metalloendopeptidase